MKTKTINRRMARRYWNIIETIQELEKNGYKCYIRSRDGRKIPEHKEVIRVYLTTGGGVYTLGYELKAVMYK